MRKLVIGEQGLPFRNEKPWNDVNAGKEIFSNLSLGKDFVFRTEVFGEDYLVEAFDEPLVAEAVGVESGQWRIQVPFGVDFDFQLKDLGLDEWDRFHGHTRQGLPFVLSPKAQFHFFDLLDEFGDEFIVYQGVTYPVYNWPGSLPSTDTQSAFAEKGAASEVSSWQASYESGAIPWDLGGPAPALVDLIPRLKLQKQRIAVLGCGQGHDAAYLAQLGHIVTAFDFSPAAIAACKEKHKGLSNCSWIQTDVFDLPTNLYGQFDMVIEHTLYCAIPPARRHSLVQLWQKLLTPRGLLLGIFFVMDKHFGPPFGGSEWEYRQRLQSHFHFLFWGRSGIYAAGREDKELLVLAQKKF